MAKGILVKCDNCGFKKRSTSPEMGVVGIKKVRKFYGDHNCDDGGMGTFFEEEIQGPIRAENTPEDKWEHRSKMMLCKTCMWYMPKKNKGENIVGRCRKHAPTMGGYPVVFDSDWCGDHKLNENN